MGGAIKPKEPWDGAALSDYCYPVRLRTIYDEQLFPQTGMWLSQHHPYITVLPFDAPEGLVCWGPYNRAAPNEITNISGLEN